jgi:hypothetical protein
VFPLEGVRVQIASQRISVGGSCTPGETACGFPTRISIFFLQVLFTDAILPIPSHLLPQFFPGPGSVCKHDAQFVFAALYPARSDFLFRKIGWSGRQGAAVE